MTFKARQCKKQYNIINKLASLLTDPLLTDSSNHMHLNQLKAAHQTDELSSYRERDAFFILFFFIL